MTALPFKILRYTTSNEPLTSKPYTNELEVRKVTTERYYLFDLSKEHEIIRVGCVCDIREIAGVPGEPDKFLRNVSLMDAARLCAEKERVKVSASLNQHGSLYLSKPGVPW